MSGTIVVIGSGELGPSMVPALRAITAEGSPKRVMVMDGSYRFQTNAAELTSKIVDHLRTSVGWDAEVASGGDTDPHRLAVQLGSADVVFAGPGSPTHALRHWGHPAVVEALAGVVRSGGALVMASAAALTIGVRCIPIYEIYKAGADPYWVNGLDVLGSLGQEVVVVPHWNNREGGTHDTSHCYIGAARFTVLEARLPPSTLVLGIDEHTAVTFDTAGNVIGVQGAGSMTRRRAGADVAGQMDHEDHRATSPHDAPAAASAVKDDVAEDAGAGIETGPDIIAAVLDAGGDPRLLGALANRLDDSHDEATRAAVAGYVELLVDVRQQARADGRYQQADEIRRRLGALGVALNDEPAGTGWRFTEPGTGAG